MSRPPPIAAEPAQGREIASLPGILSPRERVEPVNAMLRERLETLLPRLMREAGESTCGSSSTREYAEDPVYLTLVPDPCVRRPAHDDARIPRSRAG